MFFQTFNLVEHILQTVTKARQRFINRMFQEAHEISYQERQDKLLHHNCPQAPC